MTFDSWTFAIFLPVVLVVYFRLGLRAQNAFLLAASALFYGWWDWRFLGLLLVSTVLDFTIGLALDATADPRRRKRLLGISIAGNLAILGTFKYLGWFTTSAARVLEQIGVDAHLPVLQIALPVGISFYTFQTMAYSIDVYRRTMPPCRDFLVYALYTSYFPQLVAGPIERAERLIPQLAAPRTVDNRKLSSGFFLILRGLCKKVALSDALAPILDATYGDPASQTTGQLWVGTYLFLFQVYFDFSGYSDVARGASRILGVELMLNFRQPFFAAGFRDFWRRWHISLVGWFRDYVFIPLGGSRVSLLRNCRNLVISMTLAGLWHGAAWGFVIWGFVNGLLVAVETWGAKRFGWAPVQRGGRAGRLLWRVAGALIAFHGISAYLIFFRAPSFDAALEYYRGLGQVLATPPSLADFGRPLFYSLVVLAMDLPGELGDDDTAVMRWRWPLRAVAIAGMAFLIICWGRGSDAPFIYFQF